MKEVGYEAKAGCPFPTGNGKVTVSGEFEGTTKIAPDVRMGESSGVYTAGVEAMEST